MITEPHIIQAAGIVEAWKAATELLVREGDRFNLNVHISSPASINEADVAPFCHRRVSPGISKSVYDVANTIFPSASLPHTENLIQFFAHYKKVYERGQRRHSHVWGTYFLRLIAFGNGRENQLAKTIEGLAKWKSKPRAAFVVHLSSAELDNPRPLGAPCCLTRLLKFVCYHSGMQPGTLTCLSTYASLQSQQAKTKQLLGIQ